MSDEEELLLTETQLIETITEEEPPRRSHPSLSRHHHHHQQHGEADTTAHTFTSGLEADTTHQPPISLPQDEEPERSESSQRGGPLGAVIFSDSLKRPKMPPPHSEDISFLNQFNNKYLQPSTAEVPSFTLGHLTGYLPLTSLFHMESNRENRGPDDDGLDDADLTAADGIVRLKNERTRKKQPKADDNLKITKGDYIFPHKTYKPKVQIAYRVPAGQVPQAVMAERLHRIYKKTDINLVLQTLGIELSDLIPPPNYGENNERFFQEMMFRNRTKINGVDKKEALANRGRFNNRALAGGDSEEEQDEEEAGEINLNMHKAEADSTLSTSYGSAGGGGSDHRSTDRRDEDEDDVGGKGRSAIHPFIQSKPPFNAQFPLNYFDNSEFDIRSGEEWCRLGWEEKEKRFYPIPGKAFLPLPLPLDKRAKARAPSELTLDEILRKTPRLEKFRSWLLRERYERQIRLVGLDPVQIMASKITPGDTELMLLARIGTTVEATVSLSDDSEQDLQKLAKRLSKRIAKHIAEVETLMTIKSVSSEEAEGEEDISISEVEGRGTFDDDDLQDIMMNLKQPRRGELTMDDDEKALISYDDVKRSASLLSDVWSDLDSLTMLGSDALTALQQGMDQEATDAEEIDEDSERQAARRLMNRPVRSYFLGDYGIRVPTSPDIDPLEDGLDQLVIDFDKMKKVHIYDWRWVDVAVFDYHPAEDKYFVCSIYPPHVFAWVSKVYLCFDAEDPNKHGIRIKDAVKRRMDMENIMRYNLYVDCLPSKIFPGLQEQVMQRIIDRATSASNIKFSEYAVQKTKNEINLEFRRSIAEEKFQKVTEKHPKTFKPWVNIPNRHEPCLITDLEQVSHPLTSSLDAWPLPNLKNFEYKVKCVQKGTVIYTEEGWKPYKEITNICLDAKEKHLILTEELPPLTLEDWVTAQFENIEKVRQFLREDWYNSVVVNVQNNLAKMSKSWYNLTEHNYDVFLMSKLSYFLQLVKLLMQDTMRSITIDSCTRLMEQLRAFSRDIDPNTDWSWGENLVDSEYPPPKNVTPVWNLEMIMDPVDGPKYSQPLTAFYKNSYTIFIKAIHSCVNVPMFLIKIMPQMHFAARGYLDCVDETEAEMIELAHNLIKYAKLVVLPVGAYIKKFSRYKDVWSLDIPAFIEKFEETEHTAKEIKKMVKQNLEHKRQLEREIPETVDITAFRIIVEQVRNSILEKKQALVNALLESYAIKLRTTIRKVLDEYAEMESKLTYRSDDIEEVVELKEFVELVPYHVARLESVTNAAIKDYEMLDYFYYPVPDEDVEAKWQAAIKAERINKLGEDDLKWLEDDYNRLLKAQQGDLNILGDQIDSTTLIVAGLVAYIELEKAPEVCEEIKRTYKIIDDMQEQSGLLNRRQKVFGLAETQHDILRRLTRDIESFKNLWFTAADWLNVQNTVNTETLDKVDLDEVTRVLTEGGKVIGRSIKYFDGADQIQHIAKSIKYQLHEFRPLVPLMKTLKKPEMRQRHWEAISEICGYPVVECANQNFKELVDQGIQEHLEKIHEIGDLASNEFVVEDAYTKMTEGIAEHNVAISFNEEFKIPVVIIRPETIKTVFEYIAITDEVLENPFNEPFKEQLLVWEKKIKQTAVNLELWVSNQNRWLLIQPTFLVPDAAVKMQVTFKIFEKMQRIWRRLIRLARDTKELLEMASSNTTSVSLQQFANLLTSIEESLEKYMQRRGSDDSDEDD